MTTTRIEVKELGKKFFHQWIFRNLSFSVAENEVLLVTGANGSGKSTLLKIISGQLGQNEGSISFLLADKEVDNSKYHEQLAWSAPWISLYENLTVEESVDLHFKFKTCLLKNKAEVLDRLKLESKKSREVKHLSSGMQLRLKTGLAILSEAPLLLLDEPTANLDAENSAWFFSLLDEFRKKRIVIFASNTNEEFSRFTKRLDLKQST